MNRVVAISRPSRRLAAVSAALLLMITGTTTLASAEEPATFTAIGQPTITGTAAVGQTLSASFDPESVSPAPDSAFLTWFVNGESVGNGDSLGLHPADLGKVITVRLTVLKGGYENGTSFSEPTVAVAKGTQSFTPVITGTVARGYKLSVTGLPEGASFSYRWKRNGSTISGATAATYTPASADVGKTISVTVTSYRAGYTTLTKTSASTAAVKNRFAATYTPVIQGTPKVGYTLTAKTTAWSPTATMRYQWLRNGIAIEGATASTRKLTKDDLGANISVKLTGSRVGFLTVTKLSASTSIVAKGTISAPTPVISGTARAGHTLKVTLGSYSPTTATKQIQWYRNGMALEGAWGSTYALKNVDAGAKISVKVTYSAAGYNTATKSSASTATIATRTASMSGTNAYSPRDSDYTYIAPGTYLASAATSACYWVRDNDHEIGNEPIAEYGGSSRWIVEIESTDMEFFTYGCGSWIRYDWTGPEATTISKSGYYGIGVDIKEGVYQRSGGTAECLVTFESDATNEPSAIYSQSNPASGGTVEISGEDNFFTTWGCGTWTRVSDLP